MTCTEAARKYIFNVDEIGYLLYRLHSILPLKVNMHIICLYTWKITDFVKNG